MLLVVASGLFFTLMMMAYKRQLKMQAKVVEVRKQEELQRRYLEQQQRPY